MKTQFFPSTLLGSLLSGLTGWIETHFVRREAGKALSSNDYTDDDQAKLAGIASGANAYELPPASAAKLGGVKAGAGLAVDEDGTLRATGGGTADAVDWSGVQNKPATYPPDAHTHPYAGSDTAGGAANTAKACTGNAATATKLATAHKINGVPFDGTEDITVADGTKVPTGRKVNGKALTGDISLTAADVGAAASGHTHTAADVGAAASSHGHADASESAAGFMSAADKKKLNGVANGANAYVHPSGAGNNHIPAGGQDGQILRWSAAGAATWGADNNTTNNPATQGANGLMAAADKKKLDGLPPSITSGTADLTPGESPLADGAIYLVYEE